jgi:hypothetical protein
LPTSWPDERCRRFKFDDASPGRTYLDCFAQPFTTHRLETSMTLATLLSHVGIDVPRYVTVGGQIVLDPTPSTNSTPAPMAVAPHRFHDGEDPAPERSAYADAWWNIDPEARAADEAAMATHFPNFVQFGDVGDYAFGGELDTGRGRFKILVMPHVDHSLPSIIPMHKGLGRPMGRRIQRPPHLYTSGNLCVAATADWKPGEHTTATAVAWAAHWFAAYTEWRISGRWPTDGFGAAA